MPDKPDPKMLAALKELAAKTTALDKSLDEAIKLVDSAATGLIAVEKDTK